MALLCLSYSCKQSTPGTTKRSAADSLEIQAKATKMAQEMIQRAKDSLAKSSACKRQHCGRPASLKSYGLPARL